MRNDTERNEACQFTALERTIVQTPRFKEDDVKSLGEFLIKPDGAKNKVLTLLRDIYNGNAEEFAARLNVDASIIRKFKETTQIAAAFLAISDENARLLKSAYGDFLDTKSKRYDPQRFNAIATSYQSNIIVVFTSTLEPTELQELLITVRGLAAGLDNDGNVKRPRTGIRGLIQQYEYLYEGSTIEKILQAKQESMSAYLQELRAHNIMANTLHIPDRDYDEMKTVLLACPAEVLDKINAAGHPIYRLLQDRQKVIDES